MEALWDVVEHYGRGGGAGGFGGLSPPLLKMGD